jgi:hypothetical protein
MVVPLLILNLVATPASLIAQQPLADVPSLSFRASSRLVTVDVAVTDQKRQPVTGLKADDFTLEENGKKQKVSVFIPPAPTHKTTSASALPFQPPRECGTGDTALGISP